jgi:hypothetical protein
VVIVEILFQLFVQIVFVQIGGGRKSYEGQVFGVQGPNVGSQRLHHLGRILFERIGELVTRAKQFAG